MSEVEQWHIQKRRICKRKHNERIALKGDVIIANFIS